MGKRSSLEIQADILIEASQAAIASIREKQGILTYDNYQNRLSHEVYVESGTPDASYNRGVFGRACSRAEPRPTNRRRYSIDTWKQDLWESFR